MTFPLRMAAINVSLLFLMTEACLSACTQATPNPSTIHVYVYNRPDCAHLDLLMASLSGVVARTSPEVFMVMNDSASLADPAFWLDRLVEYDPSVRVDREHAEDAVWFVHQYGGRLSGYVVYDSQSMNEATSVAGALGAIMIHESLLDQPIAEVLSDSGLEMLADVRGQTSDWVFDTYGQRLNKRMIFRHSARLGQPLRSFAILNAGMVFDATGPMRDRFLADQQPHSLVFGWGAKGEVEFFESASMHNLMALPANFLQGSAAPARWNITIPKQAGHVSQNVQTRPEAHYVAFVMSDGDNLQWLTNSFARDTRWFGSPMRGNFDFTFDLSPALRIVNPVALRYLYDEAARDRHRTLFVTAGGEGFNYPSVTTDIEGFMDATIKAMHAVDHQIISVLDDSGFDLHNLQRMVARPEILGLMLKIGNAYSGHRGKIYWHEGKPIVSVKYTLWDRHDTPDSIVQALNNAPRDPLHDEGSFSIVNVHPWSKGVTGRAQPMTEVADIVNRLNGGVRVVTLEELLIHLRNHHGRPVQVGPDLQSQ